MVSHDLELGYSRVDAAPNVEVGVNALSRMVKKINSKNKHAFVGKSNLTQEQA